MKDFPRQPSVGPEPQATHHSRGDIFPLVARFHAHRYRLKGKQLAGILEVSCSSFQDPLGHPVRDAVELGLTREVGKEFVIVLVGFDVAVRYAKRQIPTVDHDVLEDVGVLSPGGDSCFGKVCHAPDGTQAVGEDRRHASKSRPQLVSCQKDEVNGHQAQKLGAISAGHT